MMPEFPQDQINRVGQDPTAVIQAANQKQWCTLAGWVEPLDRATVQCRRSGLTFQLKQKPGLTAELLPFPQDGSSPTAKVRYTTTAGGAPQERTLKAAVDNERGVFRLELPFETTQVYDELLTAMTSPDCTIALEIVYTHPYQTRVSSPGPIRDQPGPIIRDHRLESRPIRRGGIGGGLSGSRPVLMKAQLSPAMMTAAAPSSMLAQKMTLARPMLERADIAQIDPQLFAGARPDFHRVVVRPPQPTTQQEVLQDGQFPEKQLTVDLRRARTDESVFPDLPRQARNGWGQLKNPNPARPDPLHYCDSPRLDTFYYLPTNFKLGYYIQPGTDGAAGRPPLRVELYRSDEGEDRIKATLVALPCIENAERESLRRFLSDQLLQKLQPFVRLEAKSGLQAKFVDDFASGSAANVQTLPSRIRFQDLEVIPDDRLVVRFDMPAMAYPIFSELLKRGIFGRVTLSEKDFQAAIEVRLQLDDIVTNSVKVEYHEPAPASEGASTDSGKGTISVQNLLDFPLQLSSLDLNLLDTGELSDMILAAEAYQLLPSPQILAPRPDASSKVSFPVEPKTLSAWDQTLVESGQLRVQSGSVDDWLNRVHRDASLQPYDFKAKLQIVAPASIRDRVQLLRLRLFRDQSSAERGRLDVTPDAASPVLNISMTLEELVNSDANASSFSVEYETLSQEGVFSLPQRVKVNPGDTLVLRALVESPGSTITVDYQGPGGPVREDLDRAAADQLISRLRGEGKHWEVYVKQKAAEPTGEQPAGSGSTPSSAPESSPGVRVTVVTDLASVAFQNGSLKKVFVILKGPKEGDPQSSFFFDASNQSNAVWQTPGLTAPPFRFEVTYLYTNNQTREVSGTISDLTLLLDPPAVA